jgi:hypothetical protein
VASEDRNAVINAVNLNTGEGGAWVRLEFFRLDRGAP